MNKNPLIFKMIVLNKYIQKNLENDLERYSLTFSEFSTLTILKEHGSVPVQKIAKKINISSGTMTYTIKKLLKKELIEKNISKKDTRISLLSISETGMKLYDEISTPHFEYATSLINELTEDINVDDLDDILESMMTKIKR